jgi:hydrogenase expression/formation protein HypC
VCLAVPGKIIECHGDDAVVDLQGNRLRISKVLTPEAGTGSWVLVHAGFAISTIEEREALETWEYLKQCYDSEPLGTGDADGEGP